MVMMVQILLCALFSGVILKMMLLFEEDYKWHKLKKEHEDCIYWITAYSQMIQWGINKYSEEDLRILVDKLETQEARLKDIERKMGEYA